MGNMSTFGKGEHLRTNKDQQHTIDAHVAQDAHVVSDEKPDEHLPLTDSGTVAI
jgi:hypothetical protein